MTSPKDPGIPIEQFIQALTTQLDHAQSAMAVKASNLNLPLTFAVKDIALDLRTHVDFVKSEVRIRPAGPGEMDVSTLRFSLTTITRPMIDENAPPLDVDDDGPGLRDIIDDLTDEEEKKLEWVGVRNVSQLRRVQEKGNGRAVERVVSLPVERLRQALARASHPVVEEVLPYSRPTSPDVGTLLRVRGRNLMRDRTPRVTIGGEPVSVVEATAEELLVAPRPHQISGAMIVEPGPGARAEVAFDLGASGTPRAAETPVPPSEDEAGSPPGSAR